MCVCVCVCGEVEQLMMGKEKNTCWQHVSKCSLYTLRSRILRETHFMCTIYLFTLDMTRGRPRGSRSHKRNSFPWLATQTFDTQSFLFKPKPHSMSPLEAPLSSASDSRTNQGQQGDLAFSHFLFKVFVFWFLVFFFFFFGLFRATSMAYGVSQAS